MENNTTTYTAIIDTQVKGEDQVKELNQTVEDGDKKFLSLRRQIRETTVQLQSLADKGKDNTDEFRKLSEHLKELQVQQKKVAFEAKNTTDKLAELPGPIGLVGKTLKDAKESVEVFGKSIYVALGIIGLIIAAFLAFKESLSRTEEGQKKLAAITEAFEKIMNALFAVIEPIAMAFADFITQMLKSKDVMNALSVTMGVLAATFESVFAVVKGLGQFIVGNFINAFKTLISVGEATGKVLKGVFTFDYDLIKQGVTQAGQAVTKGFDSFVDNAKAAGTGIANGVVHAVTDGFKAGEHAFDEGSKRMTEKEKEAAKKRKEEAKKNAEAAEKILAEIALQKLDEREAALLKVKQKHDEDKKILQKAGIKDFTDLELGYQNEIKKINDKFDEAAKKKAEEDLKKKKDDAQKGIDNRVGLLDEEAKTLELKSKDAYDKRIQIVNDKEQLLLSNAYLTEKERTKIQTDAIAARAGIEKEAIDNQILIIDNNAHVLATHEKDNYDDRLDLINQKEQLELSNEQLTEAQRQAIRIKAGDERLALAKEQTDEQLLDLQNQTDAIGVTYEKQLQLLDEKTKIELSATNLTEAQRTKITQDASKQRIAIALSEKQSRAEIANAEWEIVAGFGSLLQQLAGKNKKIAIAGVVLEQAAAIGKIVVNTGIANAKAVASSPLTFGMPWVAINSISGALGVAGAVAAGAKAIQQINSSDSGTPASGTTIPSAEAGGGGGAPVAEPTLPTLPTTTAPTITGSTQASANTQLAATIANTTGKPVRAYVVGSDITSQQSLDRKTNVAATFSVS